jgi:arsenate reductase
MTVILYHNPRCSKSRQTLELLEHRGIQPEVIRYLEHPPSPEELKRIIGLLGISAHDLIRSNESEYAKLQLNPETDETRLLAAMSQHPRLIQRPIVVSGERARIGRPPELIEDILP